MDTMFTLFVVDRATNAAPWLSPRRDESQSTRFKVKRGSRTTLRFDPARGRLDLWVEDTSDPQGTAEPYAFEFHLAGTRIVDLVTEKEVVFEGVEITEPGKAGRWARITCTRPGLGW